MRANKDWIEVSTPSVTMRGWLLDSARLLVCAEHVERAKRVLDGGIVRLSDGRLARIAWRKAFDAGVVLGLEEVRSCSGTSAGSL